jgi:hypothetical protein
MILPLPPGMAAFRRADEQAMSGDTIGIALALWVEEPPGGTTHALCYSREACNFVWQALDATVGLGFIQQNAPIQNRRPQLVRANGPIPGP